MMNKTALGTIVGAALLGLSKNRGSKSRIAKGEVLKYGAFKELGTIMYDIPNISPGWGRTGLIHHTFQKEIPIQNCQGNPYLNAAIQGKDGIERSEFTLSVLKEYAKNHDQCIKDKNGHCITLGELDTEKVKHLTNQILRLHNVLINNNLYIEEINGHKLKNKKRWATNHLSTIDPMLENFDLLYEFILEKLEAYGEMDTKATKAMLFLNKAIYLKIGALNESVNTPIAFPGEAPHFVYVREEMKARMSDHLSSIVNPFGFRANRDSIIDNRNFIIPPKEASLVIEKDGKWYPYKKPESKSNLRLR